MKFGFDAKRAFHNSSGLGNYSRDMIRILCEYFPANEYFLYNPKASSSQQITIRENMHVRYPNSVFGRMFPGIWRQAGMSRQISKDGIDLFHGLSAEITRGIDRSETKVVVTIHDLIPERFPEFYKPVDRRIYKAKMQYAVENADRIIAISEQTRADILHFLDADEQKIRVHYQGCHAVFKQLYSTEVKEEVIRKYALPREFILNVGTLEKRKNALSILQAIRDLPYSLVLVGRPTEYLKELKEYIYANRMEHRVYFLQGVNMVDLALLYQSATLFCYPSVFEGFGIPIIEALFSKTAVITSSGGCFPEAGGPDSVYVEPGNVQKLSNQIDRLMKSDSERLKIAEAGFTFVQKFNDENVGTELMNIYTELIS